MSDSSNIFCRSLAPEFIMSGLESAVGFLRAKYSRLSALKRSMFALKIGLLKLVLKLELQIDRLKLYSWERNITATA
jgi:hypothetical protein